MTTILFLSTNDIYSYVIEWFTGSKVSHCAIGGLEVDGVPMVLHATVGGVQFITREKMLQSYNVIAEYKFVNSNIDKNTIGATKELGTPYDYLALIGLAFVIVGRWLRYKWKNPLAEPNAVICSEFVLGLNVDGEVLEWANLDHTATTPGDLYNIAIENRYGGFIKV